MTGRPPSVSSLDLTDRQFGSWTALRRVPPPGTDQRGAFWLCRCVCGTESAIRADPLIKGRSTRCATCHGAALRKDINGRVFGLWTVLGPSHTSPGRKMYWLCRCACGAQKPVEGSSLRRGKSSSCGSCRTQMQHEKSKETS